MRGLLKAGSAIDLAGAVGPIAEDAFTGGTEAQDRYFREHDDLYGKAIEYWSPKPGEVGVAAEVAGSLMATLPLVLLSPALAVGTTQLSVAEDLVKKGVDPVRAQAVGAAQAAGLGLGIYMPIFGNTLTQRVLLGGAGANVGLGIAMRGVSEQILKDTPAAEDFKAFDATSLTVDVLLGAAFGGLVHISPNQRAQGAKQWKQLEEWAATVKPTERDALSVLRQAQHLNVDSLPGKPVEPRDIDLHVQRMRQALEQASRDEPIQVSDLESPNLVPDEARNAESARNVKTLTEIAEDVRVAEGLAPFNQAESGSATGRPVKTSDTLPPPFTQDLPSKDSTRPEPSANSTTRSSTPSLSTGPSTTLNDLLGSISTTSKQIIQQPARTPERLLKLAIDERSNLENTLKNGDTSGAEFLGVRVKEQARLNEKLANRSPERISDYLGGRISVDSPQAIAKALKRISESYEIVQVDNFLDTPRNEGYRALHLGVKMANGLIAEVQIIPKPIADLLKPSHEIYTKWRAITGELSPEQMRERATDKARINAMLDDAYAKWENESETGAPAVTRGPAAPPPRGSRDAEAAGAEVNPLRAAADSFAQKYPDFQIRLGENADGTPITVSVKQYLEDARASAADARDDAKLFQIAAECLLGGA